MARKLNDGPGSRASLGLARLAGGFALAGGAEAVERSRGCPACNREDGRSTSSQSTDLSLRLEPEDNREDGEAKAIAHIVIDYCPRCGRIYDVRCSV